MTVKEAGDWFWAKYPPDGTVQREGKVGGCANCHGAGRANDHLPIGIDHSGH